MKVTLLGMPEIATGLSLGVYMVKWHRVGFGEGAPAATFPFKELKGGNNTEGSLVTIRLRNKLHGNTDLQNKNIDREKREGKKRTEEIREEAQGITFLVVPGKLLVRHK